MKAMYQLALANKMIVLMLVLFSVNSLADVFIASFVNVEWGTLSFESKLLIIVIMVKSYSATLLAFFNKSFAKIESGQNPFSSGDTGQIYKPSSPSVPTQQTEQQPNG